MYEKMRIKKRYLFSFAFVLVSFDEFEEIIGKEDGKGGEKETSEKAEDEEVF